MVLEFFSILKKTFDYIFVHSTNTMLKTNGRNTNTIIHLVLFLVWIYNIDEKNTFLNKALLLYYKLKLSLNHYWIETIFVLHTRKIIMNIYIYTVEWEWTKKVFELNSNQTEICNGMITRLSFKMIADRVYNCYLHFSYKIQ